MRKKTMNGRNPANRYTKLILAVVAALFVFGAALGFSSYINNTQISVLNQNIQQVQQGVDDLQVASILGDSNSSIACAIFHSSLSSLATQLSNLGLDAQQADIENQSGQSYTQTVDELNYARVEYWLLSQKISNLCGGTITTILMFYNPANCPQCVLEGDEVNYISSTYGNVSFTALDGTLNLNVVNVLNNIYNLTSADYPALVINSKYVVDHYRNTSSILSYLCTHTNMTRFCNMN